MSSDRDARLKGDEQQPYSKRDAAVAAQFADRSMPGTEPPLMKLAVRASAVAVDRWGVELEADEQAHRHFNHVLEDTVIDTLRHYSDEDSHVEGITELVFEGRPISSSDLLDAAAEVTDVIEQEGRVERNSPGGLVEEVDQ
ncbi:hypothetical protein [Natronocalculus amylovorans]|uniref:Uncharacterized protein n=1 Tax=Natronocalculus amylovorans TaxID=2917812 RepID=A0AAE3FZP7_9EURY|nr:hypothetical protein [Natronocalculus amylovorans]MCL9818347.1 hypothetical protein [Natronocalculus amylovorans]